MPTEGGKRQEWAGKRHSWIKRWSQMPGEEGGGRWREGTREKEWGAEVHAEKDAERTKRRKGTKDGNRGRDKGKMQTVERGESQREGEREVSGWQMEGGGSGEDRCQDKVEEKVREGQREDHRVFGAGVRQEELRWDEQRARRNGPLPSVGLTKKQK